MLEYKGIIIIPDSTILMERVCYYNYKQLFIYTCNYMNHYRLALICMQVICRVLTLHHV